MTKMQKYRFMLFAYFPEDMHPEDVLEQAEGRFGKGIGNKIISMKDCGVADKKGS